MRKKLKNILGYNIKTLLGFELLYKLISVLIFVPLFLSIFHFITKISGFSYLTFENFFTFLTKPLSIIFLLLLIIIITYYTLIDISTIIVILDASYQKQKITIKEAFIKAIEKSKKIFKLKNIFLPFLIIFLIPFLNIGISSSFISTISIPEFITDFIMHNTFLTIVYYLAILILAVILFRWLFVLHYFVLEDCNFKEARKRSIKLSKKNKLKDFLRITISQIVLGIVYVLFILLNIILIMAIYKLAGSVNILGNLSITIIWLIIAISFIIIMLLATPFSYALISILYYHHKDKTNEKIAHIKIKQKEQIQIKKKFNIIKYAVIILVIGSATLFTYSIINGKYDLNVEYIRTMEVTAHRGASVDNPENTMSAFRGAKEKGADWIELDVQQTKDGKIIVMHDTNLKRTTGVNKNTWTVTYDEIKDLDAGSFFSSDFKDERIPLFSEVVEFAKNNNIKLNIELKPTGHEKEFEKNVIDIVNNYDYAKNCVITSQVYEVLENVKKYDQNIKTVYVMSLAYGYITDLKEADSFSIEASSITKTLVSKVHNSGKEIYAWTVNTKESISKMVELNVDNIITDNITLAKDTIYESKTSNLISIYIKFIENLLN